MTPKKDPKNLHTYKIDLFIFVKIHFFNSKFRTVQNSPSLQPVRMYEIIRVILGGGVWGGGGGTAFRFTSVFVCTKCSVAYHL